MALTKSWINQDIYSQGARQRIRLKGTGKIGLKGNATGRIRHWEVLRAAELDVGNDRAKLNDKLEESVV